MVELAIRCQIISQEGGGVVLDEAMKHEAIDHFAAEFHEKFNEFQIEALSLFRDMVRARLLLHQPERADLWPMVAFLAMVLFDKGQVLRALWEGALKPGAI